MIDYNAGEACNVVIKLFTCIKFPWDRVGKMFATVLTIISTRHLQPPYSAKVKGVVQQLHTPQPGGRY